MRIVMSLLLIACLFTRVPAGDVPAPTALSLRDSLPSLLSIVSGNAARPDAAALDEVVVLRVRPLRALMERSTTQESPIALVVDGMPLRGTSPCALRPERDEIAFLLSRSGPARTLWDGYLQTRGRDHFFTQHVSVTAGLENGTLSAGITSDIPNFSFILVRRPIFFFCIGVAVFLFVLFHILAYKSDLLRDAGADPASGRKPYSLSRTQMALWFFVVVISFLMLWVETGRIDTMPSSVIALLGISTVTALGAAVIDARAKRIDGGEASDDFIYDILSDGHGLCFHRFQMAGWTLVLAVVFLYTVFTELRMPEFDSSILLLMGISSGTYLGYKIPERGSLGRVTP